MLKKFKKFNYIKNSLIKYRKIFVIFVLIIVTIGLIFIIKDTLLNRIPNIPNFAKKLNLGNFERRVITPSPLRVTKDHPDSYLTVQGVLNWSNHHREENSLKKLALNKELTKAAELKMQDMFDRQYFEHDAPSGEGPSHWIQKADYSYIIVGENLALGNFKDDEALVMGWMNSPGHRANILSEKFTDIGMAVKKDNFEGKDVWIAVQEFGMPQSACPIPEESLQFKISAYETQMNKLEKELVDLKKELEDQKKFSNKEDRDIYNTKVDQYNAILLEYKTIAKEINKLIDNYNSQVEKYNICAN